MFVVERLLLTITRLDVIMFEATIVLTLRLQADMFDVPIFEV